jgi:hypothetical protein
MVDAYLISEFPRKFQKGKNALWWQYILYMFTFVFIGANISHSSCRDHVASL